MWVSNKMMGAAIGRGRSATEMKGKERGPLGVGRLSRETAECWEDKGTGLGLTQRKEVWKSHRTLHSYSPREATAELNGQPLIRLRPEASRVTRQHPQPWCGMHLQELVHEANLLSASFICRASCQSSSLHNRARGSDPISENSLHSERKLELTWKHPPCCLASKVLCRLRGEKRHRWSYRNQPVRQNVSTSAAVAWLWWSQPTISDWIWGQLHAKKLTLSPVSNPCLGRL